MRMIVCVDTKKKKKELQRDFRRIPSVRLAPRKAMFRERQSVLSVEFRSEKKKKRVEEYMQY